ncbi:MAG: SIS domain-containing protein [Candidatus Nitrosotenuis sp.]
MFDIKALKKYDVNDMYMVYDNWPDIARKSYNEKFEQIKFKNITHIVFAGMGGSGIIGDIFYSILSKTNIHVSVVKGYHLPRTIDNNTLVVATSITGNTAETLSVLKSAKKAKCKIIGISGGGRLRDYCKKNNIEYRFIKIQHSPRASLTQFLYAMLKILQPILPIQRHDIIESIDLLNATRNNIRSKNLTKKNIALNLAEWVDDIPIIYYPWGLKAAAIRFKNSLNENAKSHAMVEDIIEASHNNIVAWERISNVKPILLEGKDDDVKTKERANILKKFFRQNNIEYKEVFSVDGSILSKLVNLIYVFDYASIYLAVKHKIDPTPVGSIDFIKRNSK